MVLLMFIQNMMKWFSSWIICYFLHSASVLSFYRDVVLSFSIICLTYTIYHGPCHMYKPGQRIGRCPLQPARNPIINPDFIVRPGTPILDLTWEAENIIAHSSTPNSLIHVYFIAGLIDITKKIEDHIYEKVIFNESFEPAPSCVMSLNYQSSKSISKTGATPCYATITPMHLNTWNEHRLNIHRTSYLLHHNHYDSMQTNLIKTITEINSLITELYISNHIQTQDLHNIHCTNQDNADQHTNSDTTS